MTQATLDARAQTPPARLPRPIRRVLGRVGRRLRAAALLRGLGRVALVLAVGAALGMAADFAGVLPEAARWAIWGGWLAATGATMVIGVLYPMVRGAGVFELAALAERAHPGLGERLTGAVALLGPHRARHGSPALIAALAVEAATLVAEVDPARAVPLRRPARALALGLVALGLVAAPAAFGPAAYRTLARRFLAPWADLDRIGRFILTVAPGDHVAAIGDDMTIRAGIRPRFGNQGPPESAWLEWAEAGHEGQAWHRVAMPAGSDSDPASPLTRAFAVTLPRLTGSMAYRVVSGSAASRSSRVTALEPPAVAAVAVKVEPPAYTRLPVATAPDPGRIEAWEGSRVSLVVTASRPVREIAVDWPSATASGGEPAGARRVVAALSAEGTGGTATVAAEASGTYAVTLRDAHGLVSRPETPRRLIVRFDAAPVVAVAAGSTAAQESSPEDVLAAGVAARDDVAVAGVELHYAIERQGPSGADGPESGHVAVPLPGLGTRAARGEARLELRPLNLRPGDTLGYRVRVADNRPAPRGPNVTWSPARSLTIVAKAAPLEARRSEAERARLQEKLDELKKAAADNRREAEQLRYAADAVQRGNGRWEPAQQQALDRREAEARAVADRLQLLARELADEPDARFRPLARPARQIAEVEAESSRAMLDRARRDSEDARRLDDLRQADHRLAAVVQRLDDLQRQFDALARRDADLQRLRDLAGREEAIADRAGGPIADLDRLRADQDAVQKDLDALLKKAPELRGDVLDAQAVEADALARKAHALAEAQREQARQAGEVAPQAGKLKELAEAQRALEEDARRLALEVDMPLAENGRGRLNTGVLRDAVEPIERGDLDQARQRLEGAEAELRRLARDLDDVPADPKAIARRLSRRQEALNAQVNEALRPFQGKAEAPATVEEKAARAAQLKPLADRQEAIARLAAAIEPPEKPGSKKPVAEDAVRDARKGTAQAVETMRNDAAPAREIAAQQNKASAALNRLAGALPDLSARRAAARRQLDEARRQSNEAARDLERLLRETGPRPNRPADPARDAEELARRLEPVIKKQDKAAEVLGAMEVEPRDAPQRDRAARRAEALAEALKAARAGDVPSGKKPDLRDALPGLQAEAHAALDRLEQKLGGRVPADDLADELAADQHALQARLAHPDAGAHSPPAAVDQHRIATALRNLDVPDAPLARAEAVRLAEDAARALADPRSQPIPGRDPREAVRAAAEAADALSARLARPGPAIPSKPEQAQAPDDPELGLSPRQAAEAEQLARRERQLRERLQAVLAERVAPQQDLRRDAVALGREMADLRDRTRPLSDRARGPAQEAAQALGEQAPRAMDQGVDRLAQGQAAAARDAQRQAAAVVERGAQQAEDLADALRAERGPAEATPQGQAAAAPVDNPHPLAEARAAMRQAAQQLDPAQAQAQRGNAAQAARQAMQQAARDLRAAAQRGTPAPGQGAAASAIAQGQAAPGPGTPQESDGGDPQGTLAGAGAPDLTELKATIARKTGRAWGELPGHLRTEILQMSQGRYRDDYARLIQLYFREIAAGAEKPE
ncbi:MAG TPA: hypothetical protein VG406_24365 [Isosphaeraceae bacterium]|nr:hypothetical protein [Isosphaeraceae bacterium]